MPRPAPPTLQQLGEARTVAVLRRILDRPATDHVVPNGDDALVWRPGGDVVATVDSVVEGVDWMPDLTPAEAIGHRAAAVNLSDLAAMGAAPRHLLLAIEAPPQLAADVLVRAARGMAALADAHGCAVAGGDFGLSPGPLRLTVTALGEVRGPPLRRDTAKPRDKVWLVGEVGMAALGLQWLRVNRQLPPGDHWALPFVHAHLWPQPLVGAGRALQALARDGARVGCIDLSDGLGLDAGRVARASGVGMVLEMAAPAWPAEALAFCAEQRLTVPELCGTGGDDYALLVIAEPSVDIAAALPGHLVRAIGVCTVGPAGTAVVSIGGVVVAGKGYLHGG